MADQQKIGADWQDDELDAIVADYFAMLEADLAGHSYVKSAHSKALMNQIGRTHRSVEFKHQNISAVLDELGLPWIPGYKPKRNYQNAIFGALDRYLSRNPAALERVNQRIQTSEDWGEIFVPQPKLDPEVGALPAELARLVRKFDPVLRDFRNRALGRAGEEFVLQIERRNLAATDRHDLARKIRWVSTEDGDGAGYDILSFNPDGRECLLEVKTTNGPARTPFFLTRNELAMAKQRALEWRIYRVHCYATGPRIFTISPPLENSLYLSPESWSASFSTSGQ